MTLAGVVLVDGDVGAQDLIVRHAHVITCAGPELQEQDVRI